jgi:hypothetical protein
MRPEPGQRCCLVGDVCVDNILLEEPACTEERREERTDVKIVPVKDPLVKPRPLTGPVGIP